MSAHPQRIEVITRGERRRRWSASEKQAIVAESLEQVLNDDPFGGALFAFCGRRGGIVKLLWYDGQSMCLYTKRLERGHFVWPLTQTGRVSLTPAQLRSTPQIIVRCAENTRCHRKDSLLAVNFAIKINLIR